LTILQAVVLGLVQGLTEFIPISSTAHLRVVPELLGWGDPGAAASAVIQLGTLLAVLIYFAREIAAMTASFVRGLFLRRPFHDDDSRLAWYVGLGSIPIVIVGLALKDFIKGGARSLWIVAFALIAVALLLGVAELLVRRANLRTMKEMTLVDAMAMGLGQVLALVPGSSRSGSTIMVGLFCRLNREAAARFSFLLSIPAILGSGLFELVDEWDHLASLGWAPIIVSIVVSFVSGWASIWFLLRFLRTHTTLVFIVYRVVAGGAILAMLATGALEAL
jgi:undecaprenyl-diphosphatase